VERADSSTKTITDTRHRMKHYKVLQLSEADIARLENASAKGASAAKEIRGLRKEITDAGDHGIAEVTELHEEMDTLLHGVYEELAGKPAASGHYKDVRVAIIPASKGSKQFIVLDIATNAAFANEKFKTVSEAKAFAKQNGMTVVRTEEPEIAKKARTTGKRKTAAAKRVAEKGVGSRARAKAKAGKKTDETKAPYKLSIDEFYATGTPVPGYPNQYEVHVLYTDHTSALANAKSEGHDLLFGNLEGMKEIAEDNGVTVKELRDNISDYGGFAGEYAISETVYRHRSAAAKPASKRKPSSAPKKKAPGPLRGNAKKAAEMRQKREALLASTLSRKDLQELTEAQVLAIARQFQDVRMNVRKDETTASKERLSPTPANLIRWMRSPGGFDMIGIDSAKATTPTADLKIGVSEWFKRYTGGK
jgi:hypothetical protein